MSEIKLAKKLLDYFNKFHKGFPLSEAQSNAKQLAQIIVDKEQESKKMSQREIDSTHVDAVDKLIDIYVQKKTPPKQVRVTKGQYIALCKLKGIMDDEYRGFKVVVHKP